LPCEPEALEVAGLAETLAGVMASETPETLPTDQAFTIDILGLVMRCGRPELACSSQLRTLLRGTRGAHTYREPAEAVWVFLKLGFGIVRGSAT
jgi:hypothetical protein